MEKSQKLSDYFKHNIIMFRITGIWLNLKELEKTPWLVSLYSFVVNFSFILYPQVCHVIYMYKARNNVKAFADEFYVSLSSVMVVLKSYSLLKNFDVIGNLLVTMDSGTLLPKNEYQTNQIRKVMGLWKKSYWLYATLALSFAFLNMITPLIDNVINGARRLPLVDCYPFNVYVTPTFQIMYIYQFFVLICLVVQNFNLDTLIIGLVTTAAVQCDILCNDLENLKLDYIECGERENKMDILDKKFIECIKHHKEIHRFMSIVSYCFSLNIFQQFSCSVITFCTTMFELSMESVKLWNLTQYIPTSEQTEPLSQDFFTIVIYQCACFLQIFLFCWIGTELTDKSKKIPYAAYESDWINASKTFKTNLLIFLQNAQKPLQITALLFPVCIDMFIQIVRCSFSYYTMLISLNEG